MVTPEAWKVFNERIPAAREKFEAAWAEDKSRFQAPTDMIRVCRDLGLERATMEIWFSRAGQPGRLCAKTRLPSPEVEGHAG